MGVLWDFCKVPMGFQRGVSRILKEFYDISMTFLCDSYGLSIGLGFVWYFYGMSVIFPMDSYGVPMGFL